MRRRPVRLLTNFGLLLATAAVVLSGLVIQFGYHMGHHGSIDQAHRVFGMGYMGWSLSHKITIVVLTVLVIVHTIGHWAWYRVVVRKSLYGKNKMATTLTVLFVLAAVTGYLPWIIDWTVQSQTARKGFIEVHDKITWLLSVCFIAHAIRRRRWFGKGPA
jgi:hypothetical protein